MIFLDKTDFNPYIKEVNLNTITQGDDSLLNKIEAVAISEMQSYTSNYFDNDCLYPIITSYATSSNYNLGDYVNDSGSVYIVGSTVSVPHSIEDIEFKLNDPRNALTQQMMIDIVLYHLHSRISPHQIPELRILRYQDTKDMLKAISTGLIGGLPSSCKIDDGDGDDTTSIFWGSNIKINQRY